jgi:hypothetical protein
MPRYRKGTTATANNLWRHDPAQGKPKLGIRAKIGFKIEFKKGLKGAPDYWLLMFWHFT